MPARPRAAGDKLDEPLNIHGLKRFVTDWAYGQPRQAPSPVPRQFSERVAIVGSGPCGLTAAQDLCKLGYPVTIFESLPVAGGMMRVGVPEFRLPAAMIDREVQDILDLGVELRLNSPVAKLDDASSTRVTGPCWSPWVPTRASSCLFPAPTFQGVMLNTSFLRDARLGNPPDITGKRVMVLGGGNVAVDVCPDRRSPGRARSAHGVPGSARQDAGASMGSGSHARQKGHPASRRATFPRIARRRTGPGCRTGDA